MDFRPNTNTLVLNYIITFGVVGVLLYLSAGSPTRYFYSPEYNSHAGYGTGAKSCRQCHTQPWEKFEERTCWTGGCHTAFDPAARTGAGMEAGAAEVTAEGTAGLKALERKQDEFGMPKPHFGATVALHQKIGASVSCSSCHPSHQVPQTGRFNRTTVRQAAEERFRVQAPKTTEERRAVETEIFHRKAEEFTGKLSCGTCHGDTPGLRPGI